MTEAAPQVPPTINQELIGQPGSASKLQTPALVLDLDRFEANMSRMKADCAKAGIKLRPHSKTHKSIRIAREQIKAGAIGICCAKLGEAEVMIGGGIPSVLITSPIVTPGAIERLCQLGKQALDQEVLVVVDNADNIDALQEAASSHDQILNVLLDLDPGLHRTGIPPGEAATALALKIQGAGALNFRGLQMYAGHLMHIDSFAERQEKSLAVMKSLGAQRDALMEHGLSCDILTGGGTGSFDIDPQAGVLTDLQAGSYLFMDRQYNAIESATGSEAPAFFTSLFVQTTVISANHPGLATTDAGLKAFATDDEAPPIHEGGPQDARYFFFGDEQGGVRWRSDEALKPGQWLRAVTPHCDPTINLYDVIHIIRGDTLTDIWTVDARGRLA